MVRTKLDFTKVVPLAALGLKKERDLIMTHFYGWSVNIAKRVLRDPEQAKNAAVDFWEWMFTNNGIEKYDPDKGPFMSWMEQAVRHRAIMRLRATKDRNVVTYVHDVPDRGTTSGNPVDIITALDDFDHIMDRLDGQEQDVMWRLMDGTPLEEIADELGCSIKRAQNIVSSIRKVIQEEIDADV